MDTIMIILQIIVLLGAIFIGIRLGGIAIGYAGGLGVVVLGLVLGMKPGNIPWDVILIIAAAIAAISAMQQAGGLDYMVRVTEKILRSKPRFINYLAPACGWLLTILAGTGNAVFSLMPVVVDVAKSQNIKPSAPLSLMVVSSQIGITASPVSAAVVYMSGVLEPFGWSYPALIGIWIGTTFIACMITAFIVSLITPMDLSKDPVYQERLKAGFVKDAGAILHSEDKPGAKLSVAIFLITVLAVVFYATTISDVVRNPMVNYVNSKIYPAYDQIMETKQDLLGNLGENNLSKSINMQFAIIEKTLVSDANTSVFTQTIGDSKKSILSTLNNDVLVKELSQTGFNIQNFKVKLEDHFSKLASLNSSRAQGVAFFEIVRSYIDPVKVSRDQAIMGFLLAAAALITWLCKVEPSKILDTSVFKSGMTACICVFGVAWLGNTFVAGHEASIKEVAGDWVKQSPAMLAVAFFFASMLLYSQAATAKAIVPVIVTALGISATNPQDSYMLVACFAAVSALFVLPTYPTLLGAVQMDDTGTTRIGKFIFNHSFFIPGVLAIAIAVALGFVVAPMLM